MSQAPATAGPFLARTAEDLTQLMLDHFVMLGTPVTDLSEGSVTRTEIEAVGQLGEQFYADMATKLQDALTQSAYQAFNFTPLPSKQSSGYLVFNVTQALSQAQTFVAGTSWQPSGQSLTCGTTTTFTIPGGTTGRWHVPAACLTLGAAGNLAAGATGDLQYAIPGIAVYAEDGAVNAGDVVVPTGTTPLKKGFTGGLDPETPLEMHTRFTSFLSSLHRATLDALQYGATTTILTNPDGTTAEQVALARAVDTSVDAGLVPNAGAVNVYVFNGIGSPGGLLTSAALLAAAQNIINGTTSQGSFTPGYKGAGIPATVFAATEFGTSLSIAVTAVGSGTATAVPSAFLQQAVTQAVQTFFANLHIGDKFLLSALTTAIGATPGVQSSSITALTIVRQTDSVTVTSTVGDYTTPTNGILVLAAGQPTVAVS